MNSKPELSPLAHALRGALLVLFASLASVTNVQAIPPTFWTGANTNYTQSPIGSGQDVLLPGAVSLDRGFRDRMFNGAKESFHTTGSPSDTEWATATPGVIADLTTAASLTYSSFDGWVGGHAGFPAVENFIVNRAAVVHLISSNIYIAIKFSAWGAGGGGGFAYTRSTPAAVVPPPTPTVTITNPANNAVFAAPANITLAASASVSSGTVTNVSFFNLTSPLGSATLPPFTIIASNLAAGTYHLRASATAAGVSNISSIVNITVVTPTVVSNSTPTITNGQFSFSYTADPGLTYVVQTSPDLTSWLPLVTNVPVSSLVLVTDLFNLNTNRYYRVGRLPNP